MTSSNFNLRNVPPEVMLLLKRQAEDQNISVNTLILQILDQKLAVAHPKRKRVFHDLDYLAGTWSIQEKNAFDKKIKPFEQIDKELWS